MTKTIFLVDDDPNILETAQDILEAAGYDVQTASTGSSALEKLEAASPHLLIVDFNLPDTTGVALALQVKTLHPGIVIFLMTGETNVDLGAASAAIHKILTKPVNPADLLRMIKEVS